MERARLITLLVAATLGFGQMAAGQPPPAPAGGRGQQDTLVSPEVHRGPHRDLPHPRAAGDDRDADR